MTRQIRNFVRETLNEAKKTQNQSEMGIAQGEILATDHTGRMITAKLGVLFNYSQLEKNLSSVSQNTSKNIDMLTDLAGNSILGMIAIAPPADSCNGAWEVKLTAGPGYGKLVYAMGYYLSPTGKLIADRSSLSKDAQKAWFSLSKKSKGQKLDDVNNPQNTDPNDDCITWIYDPTAPSGKTSQNPPGISDKKIVDAINQSYTDSTGGADWKSMIANFAKLQFITKMSKQELMNIFEKAAGEFFSAHYR